MSIEVTPRLGLKKLEAGLTRPWEIVNDSLDELEAKVLLRDEADSLANAGHSGLYPKTHFSAVATLIAGGGGGGGGGGSTVIVSDTMPVGEFADGTVWFKPNGGGTFSETAFAPKSPDIYPAEALATHHFFGDGLTPAGWTELNKTNAVFQSNHSHLVLQYDQVSESNTFHGLYSALPEGWTKLTTKLRVPIIASNYMISGMFMRDSIEGKSAMYGVIHNGGYQHSHCAFNDAGNLLTSATGNTGFTAVGDAVYLRLRREAEGDSLTYQLSKSGVDGTWQTYAVRNISADLANAPDGIGFCFWRNGSTRLDWAPAYDFLFVE